MPVLSIVTNTWGNTTTSPFFPIVKSVFVYVAIAWGQKHNMISVCSYACIHQIMLDLTTHFTINVQIFFVWISAREGIQILCSISWSVGFGSALLYANKGSLLTYTHNICIINLKLDFCQWPSRRNKAFNERLLQRGILISY